MKPLFVFTQAVCLPLVFVSSLLAQPSAPADPKVQAALHEAADFSRRGQLSSALESAQRALKLSKGNACEECYRQIVDLQIEMDLPKDAASTASSWVAHAASPKEKAAAEYINARALVLSDRQKHDDSLLQRADRSLRQAAIDDPSDPAFHLLDGRVLALLKQQAEAKAQFDACSSAPGASPLQCRRAAAYSQNVSLATNDEAPEFTIPREDASPVTLESLAGKVVLVDFWATWCGPCARDLDYVQSIAEEFEKDNFVLLGISIDEDEAAWKNHVKEDRMIGIQVRDRRNAIKDLFHVGGIPAYFILDGNGIIRYRTTGALKDLRSHVRELIKESSSQPSPIAKAAGS
jgi:peroxiredoxin